MKRKRLNNDAVPIVWPNLPTHLTKPPVAPRTTSLASPEARRIKEEEVVEARLREEKSKDEFSTHEELQAKFDVSRLSPGILNVVKGECLLFLKVFFFFMDFFLLENKVTKPWLDREIKPSPTAIPEIYNINSLS